jgi:hypothetical protein
MTRYAAYASSGRFHAAGKLLLGMFSAFLEVKPPFERDNMAYATEPLNGVGLTCAYWDILAACPRGPFLVNPEVASIFKGILGAGKSAQKREKFAKRWRGKIG